MRSPSTTSRSRSTPWVAGCWGPMLSTMSAVARPPAPMPTVSSRGLVDGVLMAAVCQPSVAGCRSPAVGPRRATSAAGLVVGCGQPALRVEGDDENPFGDAEVGELGQARRPGLHRLVDGDAVVVGERGTVRDGDAEGRAGVLVDEACVGVGRDRHAPGGDVAVLVAHRGPS